MDRHSFLASMPFLTPCASSTWPPRRPGTPPRATNNTGSSSTVLPVQQQHHGTTTRTEIVLQHDDDCRFKVSLEPALQSSLIGQHSTNNIATVVTNKDNHNSNNNDNHGSPRELSKDISPPVQPIFFAYPKDDSSSSTWQRHATSPFAPSNSSASFDPSMTDFEIAVEYACDNNTNANSSQDTELHGRELFRGGEGPSSARRRCHHNNAINSANNETPIGTFFKFGTEGVFQVDGRQLLHVQVEQAKEPADDPNNGNDKDASKRSDANDNSNPPANAKKLPPCMVLVFPCCVLRVFSLGAATHYDRALETLQSLRHLLTGLPYQQIAASRHHPAWSPSNSSLPTSSGGEAGQDLTAAAAGSNSTNHTRQKDEEHLLRKAKRRRLALLQSQAGLEQLEHVLNLPVSVYAHHMSTQQVVDKTNDIIKKKNDNDEEEEEEESTKLDADPNTQQHQPRQKKKQPQQDNNKPLVDMGPLMTRIADDMAESFGTFAETVEAVHTIDSRLDRHHKSMEGILSAFFPTPRQKLKDRNKNNSRKRSAEVDDTESNPAQSIQAMAELLRQQKQTLQERYEYLVLPTRG